MSAAEKVVAAPAPMRVVVVGKVERCRRHEGRWYTAVLVPAEDEYSSPARVEVRSRERLGGEGDPVRVTCRLGGYARRPWRMTDEETGETRMVYPVVMTLDAI